MSEENKIPDLSWMFHCLGNTKNLIDYSELIKDERVTKALNRAFELGARFAMRRIEDLGIIEMKDIDRSPSDDDQKKWDELLNNNH